MYNRASEEYFAFLGSEEILPFDLGSLQVVLRHMHLYVCIYFVVIP